MLRSGFKPRSQVGVLDHFLMLTVPRHENGSRKTQIWKLDKNQKIQTLFPSSWAIVAQTNVEIKS